jgi:LysR family transcriptional regulator, benzoate and cis,cis-muconate-responsive activator of ben and cat genes
VLAAFDPGGVTPSNAEKVWPHANGIGLVRAGVGATFMCPSEAKHLPAEVIFRPLISPAPDPALAAFIAVAAP